MAITLRCGELDEENPSWQKVENAIRSLSGNKDTFSLGDFRKENYLGISRNDEDLYVVFVTYKNLDCHVLVNNDVTDTEHKFVIGGQAVSYSAKYCHTLDEAVRVARIYYETGDRDYGSTWENG
jgi:hypothetical protein